MVQSPETRGSGLIEFLVSGSLASPPDTPLKNTLFDSHGRSTTEITERCELSVRLFWIN